MSKLKVENLGKSYDGNVILENISFTAEAGDSIAFVSPSGSGKSTLLSMLGLLLSSTTGTVVVDGQDSDALGDKELSRLRRETFGFVFQHTQLVGSLRAVENVMAPANFAGKLPFGIRERADQLLDGLGLDDRLMHYPYQLSIGQKRRVSVARALLLDPPIVIADEPTNDLDADSSASVADTLFERAANGGILLFATHDCELASRASRVMHLEGKTFVER
ncbi:ABC transporter ATP-binding protein [Gordonibacter urolithinfaciens]|uniref:ABC transporter ATP-binding protein n=1 Tax=Gordonibacter urolithinfaciens TaxID=1335613 RepID=UPI001D5839D8|nr:ATP-binding cassette domain-containing protein [Gordonibacter urolithinfaciens]HJF63092.1 ATP-binding cassette domain-containing protein [Gordonibacter urolithinfaciens]